ncbi:High-affnity carbon uptake protein Hat/HatR [Enhygromyxa salina]|uniref:High-affnity carbon uptake protein Hat/HatR n=1 Tax=Enhygromyxa salina TaxID=215803 RepID=A0A0C1ZML6_9BACT|nr:tetratricopeptide repeat protein [Enhygromyxa salina]KIG12273.1 High-affnity carbon uptake protein Hat/HatR [Enhygromyxa salina]
MTDDLTIEATSAGLAHEATGGTDDTQLADATGATICRDLNAPTGHAGTAGPPATRAGAPTQPDRLGRYVVLGVLGQGGMGVVYTAYDPQLDRKVAIKLLHSSASPRARDRLVREAQAMARLSHPNVVPVFDSGTVADQAYIVMDHVPGAPLSAWMQQPHGWREVVEVFIAAGRGLAYAHGHAIIHRDFKPDNVLVCDTEPRRVQVLDFGLAKSLDGGGAPTDQLSQLPAGPASGESDMADSLITAVVDPDEEDSVDMRLLGNSKLSVKLTRAGSVMGTPAYMSPEQHRGEAVGPSSDQFSFCVALYEGLWGRRPFAGDTLATIVHAVINQELLPPPSTSTVPSWLWPIISRGLSHDAAARWPSMDALLDALAVDPREGRRRRLVGGAALLVFAGAAAFGLTRTPEPVVDAPKCQGAQAALEQVWGESARAAITSGYAALDKPWAKPVGAEVERQLNAWGQRFTAGRTQACAATLIDAAQSAELMDLRMACYARKLDELAPVVTLIGAGDEALLGKGVELVSSLPKLETCDDAAGLRAVAAPPTDPERVAALARVREGLAAARTQGFAGQPEPALAQVEALRADAEAVDYPPLLAEFDLRHGLLLEANGKHDEAKTTLERAAISAIAARDDDVAGHALEQLTDLVGYTDSDYDGGMRWAKLAQALLDRTPSPSKRRRAELAEQIGMVEFAANHFDAAREQIQIALELGAELDGAEHPSLANPINVLGGIHLRTGEYEQAGALFGRALKITERAYGPTHPQAAFPLSNLALVHERLAQFDEAAQMFRRVIAILSAANGEGHPNVGLSKMNLGGILLLAKRPDEAGAELVSAIEILEQSVGADHQLVARALTMRGDQQRAIGEVDQAVVSYGRAIEIRVATLGGDHPDLALSKLGLGRAMLELGRVDEAVGLLESAVLLLETEDADPIDRGLARFALAQALDAAGMGERVGVLVDGARGDFAAGGVRAAGDLAELEAWVAD